LVWPNCWFPHVFHSLESTAHCVSINLQSCSVYNINTCCVTNFVIFFSAPASLWMALQFESSRTWSLWGFPFQKTSRWGFTRVYGMLMTGLQEVAWSRQIGPWLLSPLLIEISMPKLVFCLMGHLLVAQPLLLPPPPRMLGSQRSLIQQGRRGWNGPGRITWYTITAKISIDFPKVYLRNAACPRKMTSLHYLSKFCHIRYSISFCNLGN
jgi:hypothetical protein